MCLGEHLQLGHGLHTQTHHSVEVARRHKGDGQRSRHGDIARNAGTVRRRKAALRQTAQQHHAQQQGRTGGLGLQRCTDIGAGAVPQIAQTLPQCLVGGGGVHFRQDIRRLRRDGVLHGVGQFGSPGTVQTQKKQCQTEQDFFHSSDSNRSQTARNSGRDTTMAATAPAVSSTEARAPSPASRHRSEPVRQIRAMQTVFSSG